MQPTVNDKKKKENYLKHKNVRFIQQDLGWERKDTAFIIYNRGKPSVNCGVVFPAPSLR